MHVKVNGSAAATPTPGNKLWYLLGLSPRRLLHICRIDNRSELSARVAEGGRCRAWREREMEKIKTTGGEETMMIMMMMMIRRRRN